MTNASSARKCAGTGCTRSAGPGRMASATRRRRDDARRPGCSRIADTAGSEASVGARVGRGWAWGPSHTQEPGRRRRGALEAALLAGPRRNLKPWGRPAPPGGRRRGENRGPGARTCGSRLRLARPMKGRRSPWVWRCSGGGHTHALRRSIAAPQREITRGPRGSVTSGRPNRQNCRPWRRACAVAQSFQHRPSARRVPPSCERRDGMRPALSRCLRTETDEPTGASPVPSAAPVSIMMPGGLRLRSAPPAPPRPR